MPNKVLGNRFGAILLLLILTCFNALGTDVFFNVTTVFGTQPPYNTNRIFKLSSTSPFGGNIFWRTSDISGQFYVSNALPTTYVGQMLAPPNGLTFSFYVNATNLGTVPAEQITSIPANTVNTFPAGQTAYSAQASDLRYQFSTNGNSAAISGGAATNLVISATNGMTSIVYSNAALFAGTNLVQVTSNALAGLIPAAGISAVTATNIASNQVWGATNTISIASGASAFVSTNRFDVFGAAVAATNGFPWGVLYDPAGSATAATNGWPWLLSGFPSVITNGSSTARIQSVIDAATNGGAISFQTGIYPITTNILITNSLVIMGNGSIFTNAANVPGFLFDTGTNYGKALIVDGMVFDGGISESYNTTNYSSMVNGSLDPYYSSFWTNRSGLRVECSGGVRVQNCVFRNWSGNGCLAMQVGGTLQAQNQPKFEFLFNRCYGNFIGLFVPGAQWQIPGYFNAPNNQWLDATAEYGLVEGNDIFNNQRGLIAGAGNLLVQGNTINGNWHGVDIFTGINPGHGKYCGNTINHNYFAIYTEATSGGLWEDNQMLANNAIVFNDTLQSTFRNNGIGHAALIFTNGTTGSIIQNVWDSGAVWGQPFLTPGVETNIVASVLYSGNMSTDSTNTDGTVLANAMRGTNVPLSAISTNGSSAGQVATSVGGMAIWTNVSALVASGITNAIGTNFPNGNLANQTLYYPTNDPSIMSNALVAQIAVKADTNSPTIFTPVLRGANIATSTNTGTYFTGGGTADSSIANTIVGMTLSPFVSGGGVLTVTGTILATNSFSTGNNPASKFIGNGSSITNIPAAGISTNGSTANQVLTSIGGQTVWTNASSIVAAGITNAIGTNFPNGNLTDQTLFYPTNFVNPTNGFAINPTFTNVTIMEGMTALGPLGGATNIYSSTNVLKVFNAGSAIATNGTLVWSGALNCYTNWSTGSIYTNSGSAWLLQTNGVTLYTVSGSNPAGVSTAVSGAAPPPSVVVSAYIDGNGLAIFGPLSVTNITSISNSIVTNTLIMASNSAVANLNGFSTNQYLTNASLVWDTSPASLTFQSAIFGSHSTISGSGYGVAVLSGTSNSISLDGGGVIAGGVNNSLSGGGGNADGIVAGAWNVVGNGSGIGAIGGNFIGAGLSNRVNSSSTMSSIVGGFLNNSSGSYGAILGGRGNTNLQDGAITLGGQTNRNNGKWSVAAGRNTTINHDNVFEWSDGIADTSSTNSQFRITGTNGLYVNGPIWVSVANTNTGVFIKSNTFALWPLTNSLGVGDFVYANSNGVPVILWNSNATVVMKNVFP